MPGKGTMVALGALTLLVLLLWAQRPAVDGKQSGLAAQGGALQKKPLASREGRLRPGDRAPDFRLKKRGSSDSILLSSYRGKRPVALVFGSYT